MAEHPATDASTDAAGDHGVTRTEEPTRWWDHHRDAVLYPAAGLSLVITGLVWNGALSLVLSPLWMLTAVWVVPRAIERMVRRHR